MSPVASSSRRKAGIVASLAIAVVTALNGAAAKAAVVFSDNFSTSTIDNATPVATSSTQTNYFVASTKGNGASSETIATGDLHAALVSTTSGINEVQAQFPGVALQNAGDFVDYTLTFTNNGIGLAGNNDSIYLGLYNSNGSAPVNGLTNSGLNVTSSTFATGGVQLWQGYTSQFSPANLSLTARTVARPAQTTGTFNSDQDLVGDNAGNGTYNSPTGPSLGTNIVNAAAAGIANATIFTEDLTITLNGDGSETINSRFFQGSDTTGTVISNQTVTSNTTPLATSYDGLAFGWRHNLTTGTATAMDVSNITINSGNVATAAPEPASLGALALGGIALLTRRRKA